MLEASHNRDLRVFLIILAALILPIALTMLSIRDPGKFIIESANPTPYSWTVSQLIFILPVALLVYWFFQFRSQLSTFHQQIVAKSFWKTILLFTVAGLLLDILLGNTFFVFKNPQSTLAQVAEGRFPLHLPGYDFDQGRWIFDIPVEEVAFYFFGSLFMLMGYIWVDLYWLPRHGYATLADLYHQKAQEVNGVISLNWPAFLACLVIIALLILYKKVVVEPPGNTGWPAYATVLVIGFLLPTFLLFRTTGAFINWKAMSLCTITLVSMSLIWEGILAIRYGWWDYNPTYMLGIFVGPSKLPIEAIFLWFVAAWGTVNIYEFFRIHHHKGTSLQETLLGT